MSPQHHSGAGVRSSASAEVAALPSTGIQLHLGSGPRAVAGWLNVDKSRVASVSRVSPLIDVLARAGMLSEQQRRTRWPLEVIRRDLTKPFPWDDCSARAIYSSHMLEHLSRAETRGFLQECSRVLARGGVIRLALPNLAAAVVRYQEAGAAGNEHAADDLIGFLYFVPPYEEMSPVRRVAMRLLHRPHRWMYDAHSMCARLRDAGFVSVRECAYREGRCPDLQDIEHRNDERFEGSTFFVEGVRP